MGLYDHQLDSMRVGRPEYCHERIGSEKGMSLLLCVMTVEPSAAASKSTRLPRRRMREANFPHRSDRGQFVSPFALIKLGGAPGGLSARYGRWHRRRAQSARDGEEDLHSTRSAHGSSSTPCPSSGTTKPSWWRWPMRWVQSPPAALAPHPAGWPRHVALRSVTRCATTWVPCSALSRWVADEVVRGSRPTVWC